MHWSDLIKLNPKEIQALQNFKLRKFFREQVMFSSFYRALFKNSKIDYRKIKTVEDLRQIPFTQKLDLLPVKGEVSKAFKIAREDGIPKTIAEEIPRFRQFILEPNKASIKQFWPLCKKTMLVLKTLLKGKHKVLEDIKDEYKPIFFTATTGRSSEQVLFFYSLYDLEILKECGNRIMRTAQLNEDWKAMNIFPYAPHLAYWQTYYAGISSRMMVTSTGGGKVIGTDGNIKLIERLKPEAIIGVPSYVYHLFREAAASKRDFSNVNTVILGAEKVPVGMKKKMRDYLCEMGANEKILRILGTYGFTEARKAWVECPTDIEHSSGYHLYPDLEVFEIVNPETGELVSEGEPGEIVYTPIDARSSIVLRYRTGDFAKEGIVNGRCPFCNLPMPRLSSHLERLCDNTSVQLTKIKGTLVNLGAIGHLLSDMPEIEEWAIDIKKQNDDPFGLDSMILNVSLRKEYAPDEKMRSYLSKRMNEAVEITPNVINFMPLNEITEKIGLETKLKEQRIFDLRPKNI